MGKIVKLRTKGEAFEAYERCTSSINSPWPFPDYWIDDWAEFEVLHGGGNCDVRVGKVAAVFSDDNGELCYRMKTSDEVLDISYAAFYGNWTPGEVIKTQLKCRVCDGSGLKPEVAASLKKIKRSGKEGYKRR